MSYNIYGTTLSDYVKNQPKPEFVYQRTEEIDFLNFYGACEEASTNSNAESIPFYKLEKICSRPGRFGDIL